MTSSSRKGKRNKVFRILTAACVILAGFVPAASAATEAADTIKTDAASAFVRLPVSTLDIIPTSTRLDMLDYFAADSVYQAPNAMEGLSWLTDVKPDFLEVRITDASTLQVKILPAKKEPGSIVMTIYTVGGDGQASDSDVRFFDWNFKELPREKYLKMPQLKEYLDIPKGSLTSLRELEETVPFPTFHFSASPGSDALTGRLTVGDYMTKDDYNILKLFVRPQVVYTWTGKDYRPEKK